MQVCGSIWSGLDCAGLVLPGNAHGRLNYGIPPLQIVAVPSLQSGGMENVGLNTFDASHILACPATATDDDYQNVERESTFDS